MEKDIKGKLIFIYNANSGIKNSILDAAHKALSPHTYQCNLCDLTFDVFNEKKSWKQFREQADRRMEFLHKDEYGKLYASKFGYKFEFPIVLISVNEELQVFITTKELNALENTEALMDLIKTRSEELTA